MPGQLGPRVLRAQLLGSSAREALALASLTSVMGQDYVLGCKVSFAMLAM